jgi:RNA polymerase sigma factor (sigma-70 family)
MGEHVLNGTIRRVRALLAPRDTARDDAELLRGFARGDDADAFTALVRRHGPMVLGACRRLLPNLADAEDAFQATFIVLARKAGSLRRPERLAGWLYQVAFRVARKARRRAAQLAGRERSLTEIPTDAPVPELVWRELRPLLDEELGRLPERLRLPVVLCFLEGLTKREAARRLSWPEGTVSSRLQAARERLRERLTRRGLALSAGLLHLALFQNTAPAAVPAALAVAITQTATAATTCASAACLLAEGVVQSMFVSKLKVVAAGVLTLGLLGGGSWVVTQKSGDAFGPSSAVAADPQAEAKSANKPPAEDLIEQARQRQRVEDEFRRFVGGGAEDTADGLERLRRRIADTVALVAEKEEALKALRKKPDSKVEQRKLEADIAQASSELAVLKDRLFDAVARMKREEEQLGKQLAEAQVRLREMQAKLEAAKLDEQVLKAKVEQLRVEVVTLRDRLVYTERMAEKGFATKAHVEKERARYNALLAEYHTLINQQHQSDAQAAVKSREEELARMTKLVAEKAASEADLDKARLALAEAKINFARVTIRYERRTVVEVRGRELQRALRLLAEKVVAEADVDRARKALDEAKKRLDEDRGE